MSSPELHQVVNNFHAYRIDHQDNPQLFDRLSSNFTWLLENLGKIMTLEHELIELQERIERLTECKIIGVLTELEKKEAIIKSQKSFIKELLHFHPHPHFHSHPHECAHSVTISFI